MAYKILEHIEELSELGYPPDQIQPISCSISNEDISKIISDMKDKVEEWKQKTSEMFERHPKLLLLNMTKLLHLYSLLSEEDPLAENGIKSISHEVSFLTSNNSTKHNELQAGVKVNCIVFIYLKIFDFKFYT